MVNAKCYYPDGSIATNDTPCNLAAAGDSASACCFPVDTCLDNGLCVARIGSPTIDRGSCTDETWQSSECAQYCSDGNCHLISRALDCSRRATLYLSYPQADISTAVRPDSGSAVFPADGQKPGMFCCGNFDPANNSCLTTTHGSSSPFYIAPAQIINNRTSGSTSPNSTETTTVVVTSTVTVLSEISTSRTTLNNVLITDTASVTVATACSQSSHTKSSSPSSRGNIAVASSVSALLGLALLVTLGFFWRLRNQGQKLRKGAQEWKLKYLELMETQAATVGGVEHLTPQQFHGCQPDELDGQPRFPAQLHGWHPNELDGQSHLPAQLES